MIKKNKIAIYSALLLSTALLLTSCNQTETIQTESIQTESNLEEIEYAGLNCVAVEDKNSVKIMKLFRQMQAEGEKAGYCPLIILRDEETQGDRSVLDEWLGIQSEDYNSLNDYTQFLLSEYKDIDVEEYFDSMSEFYLQQAQWEEGEGQPYLLEIEKAGPQNELSVSFIKDIYIAKVPTDNPYEVLAYIPMGGYNDCPSTDNHIAIAKKWYEEYGAVPCAVSYDTVQYYLAKPVTDDTSLEQLKKEHFIYCYDIVAQGVGSLEDLKRSNKGSRFWYFWWD